MQNMKLFEPIKINKLEIKNRMVVSSMVTNYIAEDGMANEKFIAYHERKAQGGFGLILPEDYVISPTAGGFKGLPGLWDDSQIPGHKELTDRVHAAGARIFCQIYHAGRQTTSQINGVRCVAPSAIPDPTMGEIPHELTVEEIHELVKLFGKASGRAKKAGFDGVEIHGAHGYLIGAFNSPFSNKRTDEYGGTPINRSRFMTEIIQEVRSVVGQDFPIQLRISACEFVDGGLGIEDAKVIAMLAEQAGIDSIHVSQGVYASAEMIIAPGSVAHGAFANNAAEIKKVVNIPVITVGRINDPLIAEAIIRSGKADMCSMARASLADPDMPKKAMEGKLDEINHCIGCLQGCNGEEMKGNCIRCLVNPMTGMESEYKTEKAEEPKKVLVVGGGVSGCEAAIVAAQRGHKVTILEKSDELGGQWLAASVPIGKADFTMFVNWQKTMIKKLGIDVVYRTEANKAIIDAYAPNAVILAYGGEPGIPPIPGLKGNGVLAEDILRGQSPCGRKAVVIGGGLVGAETADHVSAHGTEDVSVIEMLPQIAKDGEDGVLCFLKRRFANKGIHVYTSAKVSEVTDTTVTFIKENKKQTIGEVDTVIIATGRKTVSKLEESLQGASYEVITVGDAREAKQGYIDIREGYEAGLTI